MTLLSACCVTYTPLGAWTIGVEFDEYGHVEGDVWVEEPFWRRVGAHPRPIRMPRSGYIPESLVEQHRQVPKPRRSGKGRSRPR